MNGPSDDWPRGGYLTTRQFAHAIGVTVQQLSYMRNEGEVSPAYRLPGGRGELLWTAAEVRRVLAQSDRRTFRRRRKKLTRLPMDGLQPVVRKVRVKRTWGPPPT